MGATDGACCCFYQRDYTKLIEAYGGKGERVDSRPDLRAPRTSLVLRYDGEMAPPNAVGRPAATSGDGKQFVFFHDADGRFNILWWSDNRWRGRTLTDRPRVAGSISAYYFYGAWHAFYRDVDGRIQEVFTDGDEVKFNDVLTAAAAPMALRATTDPTAWALGSSQHVAFVSGAQVHELSWSNGWSYLNLHLAISAMGAMPAPAANVAASGLGHNRSNEMVQYLDANGTPTIFHWWAGDKKWRIMPYGSPIHLNGVASTSAHDDRFAFVTRSDQSFVGFGPFGGNMCGPSAGFRRHQYVGDPACHFVGDDLHIFFRTALDELVEIWGLDAHCFSWSHYDVLGQGLGASSVRSSPSCWNLGTSEHVIYIGADGHIHELYYTDRWRHNDLHLAAG